MCWKVPFLVILIQALNMHGNNEGFNGLYPLSSTEATSATREKGRQRAKPCGKQDCVTICRILDQQPLHTMQHLYRTQAHSNTNTKPATQIHSIILPFILLLTLYLYSLCTHILQQVRAHVYTAHTSLFH